MKIAILSNYTRSLVLFRGPLIKRFLDLGHTVITYAPEADLETQALLKSMGAEFRQLPFDRTTLSIVHNLSLILRFWRALSVEKPDIVLSYTIKPVIFGSLAAKIAGVKHCYSIITGLGYLFIGDDLSKRLLRLLVGWFYRVALSFNDTIFLLNRDDFRTFLEHGILRPNKTFKLLAGEGVDTEAYKDEEYNVGGPGVKFLNGSGIDLSTYRHSPIWHNDIIFLLIARLLKDKGIREYVGAARILKEKYPHAKFWIVGPLDINPSAIPWTEIQEWIDEGVITYHGETTDVQRYLKEATVYVLPSYREGLSRTILEAMAVGRPIITTDAPGCRETVVNGENGFLVQIKDVRSLADAMERFIVHPELIKTMGLRSRKFAEERFDVHKINDEILRAMGLI